MADENTGIFEAAQSTTTETYVDKLVGEGKKYRDIEELAKSRINADEFIDTIKSENQQLREFMTNQLAERAKTVTNSNEPPQQNTQGNEQPRQNAPQEKQVEKVDIEAQIREALKAERESDKATTNARIAEDAMIQKYGDKAAAVAAVQAKAQELGVSPEWVANTAFTSPKAFFTMMNIESGSTSTPAPRSDVNVVNMGNQNGVLKAGTYAFYENLRKTDHKKYMSASVQNALMKDAMEKGDDFFKR
jgi:hypothetical protein